jgi:hypothetical protein
VGRERAAWIEAPLPLVLPLHAVVPPTCEKVSQV